MVESGGGPRSMMLGFADPDEPLVTPEMVPGSDGTLPMILVAMGDPRPGGKPLAWKSYLEFPGTDILVCRNALPFLVDLPAAAERHGASLIDATVIGETGSDYIDKTHRTCRKIPLSDEKTHPELHIYWQMCRAVEGAFVQEYHKKINPWAGARQGSGYDLLRYGPGEFFNEHIDATRGHPILAHRRLAVVAFCNDNFEEGELVFPRQNVTIKPEPGLLVMFPAVFTHPHAARAPKNGVRYSIVTWYF